MAQVSSAACVAVPLFSETGATWAGYGSGRERIGVEVVAEDLRSRRVADALSVDRSALGILVFVGGVLPEPSVHIFSRWRGLAAQRGQPFELLSAPTASGASASAVVQLARDLNAMDANVVEDLAARDVEAQTEFIIGFHGDRSIRLLPILV
jgi:hypothetical protein